MKTLYLILSFFTRIPVPFVPYSEERYKKGIKMTPLIGLLIGLILYLVSYADLVVHGTVTALLLTITYLFLTGGIHLDGMADSCDGLFSGRDRDKILEIMKDSRIGAYGVIGLILWFAFYLTLFPYIHYEALILLPIIGKTSSLISAYMSNYARNSGMGKVYVDNCKKTEIAIGLLITFAVGVLLCWEFGKGFVAKELMTYLAAILASMLWTVLATHKIKKILGGVTGDTLGFVCETSQMIFVGAIYIAFLI